MASRAIIDEFLANKRIALMRPSPSKTPAAGKLDEELAPKGYEVEVVYLDREDSGRSLAELAEPVGGQEYGCRPAVLPKRRSLSAKNRTLRRFTVLAC